MDSIRYFLQSFYWLFLSNPQREFNNEGNKTNADRIRVSMGYSWIFNTSNTVGYCIYNVYCHIGTLNHFGFCSPQLAAG